MVREQASREENEHAPCPELSRGALPGPAEEQPLQAQFLCEILFFVPLAQKAPRWPQHGLLWPKTLGRGELGLVSLVLLLL